MSVSFLHVSNDSVLGSSGLSVFMSQLLQSVSVGSDLFVSGSALFVNSMSCSSSGFSVGVVEFANGSGLFVLFS